MFSSFFWTKKTLLFSRSQNFVVFAAHFYLSPFSFQDLMKSFLTLVSRFLGILCMWCAFFNFSLFSSTDYVLENVQYLNSKKGVANCTNGLEPQTFHGTLIGPPITISFGTCTVHTSCYFLEYDKWLNLIDRPMTDGQTKWIIE